MALYDDYFRNEDKPFAENLNDALLLSNVFDLTVPIEAPKMFSNSTWVNSTSPRKCGVSILTLKEGLPSGISVGTDSETGDSVLSGTGTVELSIYPNFNSFGKYESFTWENTGTIVVNLKTTSGNTIASNISKGVIESQSSELRTLQEIVVEFVFTNATLKSFGFVMSNKEQTRYGAEVGITDVTGLNAELTGLEESKVAKTDIADDLTTNNSEKVLSAKQGKNLKDYLTNTTELGGNVVWTNIAPSLNSFANGSAFGYAKWNGLKMFYLEATTNKSVNNQSILLTLPSNVRPLAPFSSPLYIGGAWGKIAIQPNGQVYILSPNGSTISTNTLIQGHFVMF